MQLFARWTSLASYGEVLMRADVRGWCRRKRRGLSSHIYRQTMLLIGFYVNSISYVRAHAEAIISPTMPVLWIGGTSGVSPLLLRVHHWCVLSWPALTRRDGWLTGGCGGCGGCHMLLTQSVPCPPHRPAPPLDPARQSAVQLIGRMALC